MKKALVVLLILAVAGGLFAQGWTFTGDAEAGIGFYFPDGEAGARAGLVSRTAGIVGNRIQFVGDYTSEAKDYGFKFRLRSENGGLGLNYGYGWLSGLNGIITGYAGQIDNDLAGISTGDLIFGGRGGEGTGLYTVVKPISILSVGFGVFGGTTGGEWKRIDDAANAGKAKDDYTPSNKSVWPRYLKYSGGVAVTIPETVKFVASFRNANKVSSVGTGKFDDLTQTGNDAQVAAGADLLLVKGLKASVAGVFNHVNKFSDYGIVRVFETAEYTGIENLTVGLGLWQALLTGSEIKEDIKKNKLKNKDDGTYDDPSLSFRGWVYASYDLLGGKIVPRLDLNYLVGGSWDNETRIHFDDRFYPNFDSKQNLFTIQPSVGIRVNKNAWFELGYVAQKYMGDRALDEKIVDSNGAKVEDRLQQAVYADIKVTW